MAEVKRGADDRGGLNGAAAAGRDKEDLGGDGALLGGEPPMGAGAGSLAGLDGGGIAVEAASLGSADGSLADAAAAGRREGAERSAGGPAGAEAIGQGARRGETGSGTPGDKGDLGGGGPLGQEGGTGPEGTAGPGGEGRA